MAKKAEVFLGRQVRTFNEPSWTVVSGTTISIKGAALKKVTSIEVCEGEFGIYVRINLTGNKYVNVSQPDIRLKAKVGDHIDPSSFREYQMTNGEVTITRCWGTIIK